MSVVGAGIFLSFSLLILIFIVGPLIKSEQSMATLIKNNPIKLFFAGLLSIVLGLNYFGFCFQNTRFLSNEEKIDIAVKYVVRGQTGIYRGRFLGESFSTKDKEAFFSRKPGCDPAKPYKSMIVESDAFTLCGYVTGFNSSVVQVKYLMQYQDKNGLRRSMMAQVPLKISNCGTVVD